MSPLRRRRGELSEPIVALSKSQSLVSTSCKATQLPWTLRGKKTGSASSRTVLLWKRAASKMMRLVIIILHKADAFPYWVCGECWGKAPSNRQPNTDREASTSKSRSYTCAIDCFGLWPPRLLSGGMDGMDGMDSVHCSIVHGGCTHSCPKSRNNIYTSVFSLLSHL